MTKQQLREAIRKIIKKELNEATSVNFSPGKKYAWKGETWEFVGMIPPGGSHKGQSNPTGENLYLFKDKTGKIGKGLTLAQLKQAKMDPKSAEFDKSKIKSVEPSGGMLDMIKQQTGMMENKPSEAPSKPKTEPAVHPGKPGVGKPKPRRPLGNPEVKPGPKAIKATMEEAEMLKQVIKRFKSKK